MESGIQRLSVEQLDQWLSLRYGMFLHFGMSTYDGNEFSEGALPAKAFNPEALDMDAIIALAKEAGMKYAVLTAKHVSGFCLWPSAHTDYHVGNSGRPVDLVREFVDACRKHGIMPGLYYCQWDNHHPMGSLMPGNGVALWHACASPEYVEFQRKQIRELMTNYGPIGEVWIDIPGVLDRVNRNRLYAEIAELQPAVIIIMNHGLSDGIEFKIDYAWPTDVMTIERFNPLRNHMVQGHPVWREIEGKTYYVPAEVCDVMGREWFFSDQDEPKAVNDILGSYLLAVNRGANFLLNVSPDKSGRVPIWQRECLLALHAKILAIEA